MYPLGTRRSQCHRTTTKGKCVIVPRGYPRIVLALMLILSSIVMLRPSRSALAQAPSITVTPPSISPHGAMQLSGAGFEPSQNGHTTTLDITLSNTAGVFPLGTVTTDGKGSFAGSTLNLPLAVDAGGTNQITAREETNPAISASILVTGTALAPSLTIGQPLTAKLGDQITVAGTGFAPGDTVTVSLGGQPLTPASGSAGVTADSTGALTVVLVVPFTARTGAQTLTFTGGASGSGQNDQAGTIVTLLPPAISNSLLVTPNPAAVGTALQLQAGGFRANEPVTFTLKFYDLGLGAYSIKNSPATADASGAATALLSIPPTADATRPAAVSVVGNLSSVGYAQPLTFAALAQLTFSPPTALPGAQILIQGSGFVSGENLYATTRLFKPPVGAIARIDQTGHFTATATLLPTVQPGVSLVVAVSGSGGDNASANFPVAQAAAPMLHANPSTAPAGSEIAVVGQGMGPDESVAFSLGNLPLSVLGPAAMTDAVGAYTATVILPATPGSGAYNLIAKGSSSGISANTALTLTPAPANQWYFAEGFTGQGPRVSFQETITVLNPNNQPAQGTISYQFPDGSTSSLPLKVKAHSLLVEDVNHDVGGNRIVSTLVKTDQNIVAERTIIRKDAAGHLLDTDFSPGQNVPQPDWYFAEGYSGITFQPYLTVQNTSVTPITVTSTLYPTTGPAVPVVSSVPPFGRYTLNLRGALPGKSFSTSVHATGPVVAERVEYWGNGAGSAKFGDGVKPGVSTPGTTWYFGYGSVLGGDEVFLSMLNPNLQPAQVQARFFDGTGKPAGTTTLTVQPGQRATLKLNSVLGQHPHSPVAVLLTASQAIVAEEAQYYGGSPNIGSHTGASIEGRQAAATRWSFASGNTVADQENEYILNPSSTPTVVVGTFFGADGQMVSASYAVPANTVVTVSANAVPGLHRGAHGSVWTTAKNVKVVVVQVLRGNDGRSALADQGVAG